jgi:phosphopantetheinyl transferase
LVVENDPHGRPRIRSLLEHGRADLPAVSIAHVEGVAVALAALDPDARLGIDVEPVVERPPGFEAVAFNNSERALLDQITASGRNRSEWVARFWCAKEAVAKATGLGLLGQPANVVVVGAEADNGEIAVALSTELRTACSAWPDRPVRAVTARNGDRAWAWTLAERIKK